MYAFPRNATSKPQENKQGRKRECDPEQANPFPRLGKENRSLSIGNFQMKCGTKASFHVLLELDKKITERTSLVQSLNDYWEAPVIPGHCPNCPTVPSRSPITNTEQRPKNIPVAENKMEMRPLTERKAREFTKRQPLLGWRKGKGSFHIKSSRKNGN